MTWLALILSLLMSLPAWAEDPARLDLGGSALVTTGRGWGGPQPLELRLSLTKPVPYRTFLVDGPPRLIVDLKGADLGLAHPQDMFICPPHASQVAALAALDCTGEADANLAVYAENRRLMLEGLPKAGFHRIAPPEGAFYIYADVSDLTDDSLAFAAEILDKAGVAVTPGLDFDPDRGARTLRFSYARATADIAEGLRRLTEFMAAR